MIDLGDEQGGLSIFNIASVEEEVGEYPPETHLCLAVIGRAIQDLEIDPTSVEPAVASGQMRRDAIEWFFDSTRPAPPFSFIWLAESLNLNAECLLTWVQDFIEGKCVVVTKPTTLVLADSYRPRKLKQCA